MRIESSFHDYYDYLQAYGERNSLYSRESTRERKDVWPEIRKSAPAGAVSVFDIQKESLVIVGIGGYVWPGFAFFVEDDPMFCFTPASLDSFASLYQRRDRNFSYAYNEPARDHGFTRTTAVNFLTRWSGAFMGYDIFHEFSAPVFIAEYGADTDAIIITNPPLKRYSFEHCLDSVSVYQLIYLFLTRGPGPRHN